METRFYGVLKNVRFAETGKYPSLLELSRQQVFGLTSRFALKSVSLLRELSY